nr:glycosyltransferase [Aridibaculum aurantiacum]
MLHNAHKADVVRLERLIEYGGIYLDLDTICVRPFKDLLEHDCILGREYVIWEGKKYIKGLGNAVILAKRQSSFLVRWYETYKNFRSIGKDQYWAEQSVHVPELLSKIYWDEITVLDELAFFTPSYDAEELNMFFEGNHCYPNSYVHHLWESVSYESHLSNLSPSAILGSKSTYGLEAKKYIGPADISS